MNFNENFGQRTKRAEEVIKKFLPKEEGLQKIICEAMNYSVLGGGKRLRPVMMQATYELFGGKNEAVIEPFMAAMEMIHTYSLVHDDLPAMDNDDLRRGRATTHIKYNEGLAILAGDGLLNFAFETALRAFDCCENPDVVARAMKILARKAGIYGMIGGQTVDIEAENGNQIIDEETLLFIHKHKTAALIESSMMIGAILAGADDKDIDTVEKIAYNIGIAFQIQDDILDVIGSEEVLGKPIGSDAKNEKLTYVSLKGLDVAKEDVKKLSDEAISYIQKYEKEEHFLSELTRYLIDREK